MITDAGSVDGSPVPGVPSDASVWHIGVHKTGTTALQAALAGAREPLRAAGVLYPGTTEAHHAAALALLGKKGGWADGDGRAPGPEHLDRVIEDVTRWPGRSVVSSEGFCQAGDEQAARLVERVGADRMHVVLTLRPLGRLLASSWQQYLKGGVISSYDDWLHEMLTGGGKGETPSFWRRNAHADVVERWAGLVGPGNVTLVVLEGMGQDAIFRIMARIIGVPDDLLLAHRAPTTNRSMTAPEAALLLELNRRVRTTLPWSDYNRLVRYGLVRTLVESRTPPEDEPRMTTPDWALDEAAARGARDVERISALGVRVVGDLAALGRRLPSEPAAPPSAAVPTDLVTDELMILMSAALARRPEVPLRAHTARVGRRLASAAAARAGVRGGAARRSRSEIHVDDDGGVV